MKEEVHKKAGGNKAIHHTITEACDYEQWAWVASAVKSSHYYLNEIMFLDKTLNVLSCFISRGPVTLVYPMVTVQSKSVVIT